jgi:TPR repeat protein
MIFTRIYSALIAFILSSSSAIAVNLIPPKASTPDSVTKDMWNCVHLAVQTSNGDGEILKSLDKELLRGNSTSGFLFEATLSGPKPVEPNKDGQLAPMESLFNSVKSTSRTDPYVVCLLIHGYRWENSGESGIEQLERLAKGGNIRAQAELGSAYRNGIGVTRNYSTAFYWLNKASITNDSEAQFQLAILYSEGNGVLPSDKISAEWLQKAANSGHEKARKVLPKAQEIASQHIKASEDATKKVEEIKQAAKKGDIEAQRELANYHIEGIGVTPDAKQAVEWYTKAANQGDPIAMRQLGVLFDKGRGIPVDYKEAANWYRAAAEKSDAQAQYNYGILVYHGVGIEKNESDGKMWIKRAADQGNQMAIRALSSFK